MAMIAIDFLDPQRLWLLLAIPVLIAVYGLAQRSRRRRTVEFTNLDLLERVAPRRPGWRRHVIAAVQLLGLVAGIIALARPYETREVATEVSGRVAIVFDVSLSMMATDVAPSRLEAAQRAAIEFVETVDPNVALALVAFSGQVNVLSPPTTNHDAIRAGIDSLALGQGTAIGDALSAAVDVVVGATSVEGTSPRRVGEDEIPGVIILLSDGTTTVGTPTSQGAAAAVEAGIPVSTIAFGTAAGIVFLPETGETVPVPVDTVELAAVAEATGGEAYRASNAQALADAYSAIEERLVTTLGDTIEVPEEQTWAWVLAALALLAGGWVLGLWWIRSAV